MTLGGELEVMAAPRGGGALQGVAMVATARIGAAGAHRDRVSRGRAGWRPFCICQARPGRRGRARAEKGKVDASPLVRSRVVERSCDRPVRRDPYGTGPCGTAGRVRFMITGERRARASTVAERAIRVIGGVPKPPLLRAERHPCARSCDRRLESECLNACDL